MCQATVTPVGCVRGVGERRTTAFGREDNLAVAFGLLSRAWSWNSLSIYGGFPGKVPNDGLPELFWTVPTHWRTPFRACIQLPLKLEPVVRARRYVGHLMQ